ncbi:MAG: hypothetical protein QM831_07755 [Kofleriaceae bacterium]
MLRYKYLAIALLVACKADLPKDQPQTFVTAVFDPTNSRVPLPNDLAFLNPLNENCPTPTPTSTPPACAQAELLASFNGKFPSDQAVAITIDFEQSSFDEMGQVTTTAPDLDLTTFTPATFEIVGTIQGAQGVQDYTLAYAKHDTYGTLTINHKGNAPWSGGQYTLVMRGGPDGVKTKDGTPVYAAQTFALIEQGKDLTNPANNGLLRAQYGADQAAVLGAQLNQLIALYKQTAFPVADQLFPHQQLAIAVTFNTQPDVTNVTIDPARGQVPLPIDLLRDATTGKLTALAACTLAGSSLADDGTCPSAAAAGFQALDGFATTGAILAPTSDYVIASTVTPATLKLYDLSKSPPELVNPAFYITQPCEFTSGCSDARAIGPVIAIQPAGATSGDSSSVFRTRPLKDNTDYAVVIGKGILDKGNNPIGSGTVANVLKFKNQVSISGKSQLVGIDDATAASLEKMRLQLQPVFTQAAADGLAEDQVAIAYTFKTQTILSQATGLAELPYLPGLVNAEPVNTAVPTALTATQAFQKYGVDPSIPHSNIAAVYEVDIETPNALDDLTGAFVSDPTTLSKVETIHALVAVPAIAKVLALPNAGACSVSALTTAGLHCAPMMMFRHGLGGGRADMLTVADTFAAQGLVTVAIDAAKHGDRSYCTSGAATTTIPGFTVPQCAVGTCQTALPSGAQGDAAPPGKCLMADGTTPGLFAYRGVSNSCTANPASCSWNGQAGIPFVSSNYLVTSNFFRTRDTMRQDIVDEGQAIRAINIGGDGTDNHTTHKLFLAMAGSGFVIDPNVTYWSSQSLGSIQGAADVATNPRISKAAFNVGGGTTVDVFTQSPAFASTTLALLESLGIEPGTSAYLQFLVVAKTVLDPADPINFAGHLLGDTLPNFIVDPQLHTAMATKKVLSQAAFCDATVPNPWNYIFAENIGVGPLPTGAAFFAGTGTFQLFTNTGFNPANFPSCTSNGALEHGFITDWATAKTLTGQTDIASFVTNDTIPPSFR